MRAEIVRKQHETFGRGDFSAGAGGRGCGALAGSGELLRPDHRLCNAGAGLGAVSVHGTGAVAGGAGQLSGGPAAQRPGAAQHEPWAAVPAGGRRVCGAGRGAAGGPAGGQRGGCAGNRADGAVSADGAVAAFAGHQPGGGQHRGPQRERLDRDSGYVCVLSADGSEVLL